MVIRIESIVAINYYFIHRNSTPTWRTTRTTDRSRWFESSRRWTTTCAPRRRASWWRTSWDAQTVTCYHGYNTYASQARYVTRNHSNVVCRCERVPMSPGTPGNTNIYHFGKEHILKKKRKKTGELGWWFPRGLTKYRWPVLMSYYQNYSY